MADFGKTLIVAIVASVVSVLGFLAIILTLALYWSSIARRIAPNRFAEPMSEKQQQWPSPRDSAASDSTILKDSRGASVASSPRASKTSNELPKVHLRE